MGNRISSSFRVTRMPKPGCRACHGMGSVRLTIHFHSGDQEWETPCWSCFGSDLKLSMPTPPATNN